MPQILQYLLNEHTTMDPVINPIVTTSADLSLILPAVDHGEYTCQRAATGCSTTMTSLVDVDDDDASGWEAEDQDADNQGTEMAWQQLLRTYIEPTMAQCPRRNFQIF